MDTIRQLEAIFSAFTAAIEIQITTLQIYGPHRMREQLLNHTLRLARTGLSTIKSFETQYTEGIERRSEELVAKSAEMLNSLTEASKTMPPSSDFSHFYSEARTEQCRLVTELGHQELKTTKEILHRFAAMQTQITSQIARIEKM